MNNYKQALRIATEAHRGQVDKMGVDYITHPVRLAAKFTENKLKIIALLHDTIEDSKMTLDQLAKHFTPDIIAAIKTLTHTTGTYEEYVMNIRSNPMALRVKLADLEDNSDTSRLNKFTERDRVRTAKYQRAITLLTIGK